MRDCAEDSVASGSWWPMTPEKIERAQEVALRLKLPVLYLVDCSGLFLPEQAKTFPGKLGAGYIFKMNSLLSASGVPQIAGVLGDCIAGGGYMPIISDKLFMTEVAYMVIAGAAWSPRTTTCVAPAAPSPAAPDFAPGP